jgi:hypothetical protein
MASDKFRFKMTSYESPNRNFRVNYDGKYVQFQGLDENSEPLQIVFAMDQQVLQDLSALMRPQMEKLAQEMQENEESATMYWELKNEVGGFVISYSGSIAQDKEIDLAKEETLKMLDYMQSFLSKNDINYHSLEKLKGFVMQF